MFKTKSIAMTAAALLTLTIAACSGGASSSSAPSSSAKQNSAATQSASLAQADIVSSGAFEGRSDHVTTGGVSLVQTADGYELVFADDFSLDGAPDPKVGFGKDGAYAVSSQVSALNNKTGAQSYSLPASFNPGDFNEVYIWCEQFSVPLGVATLNAAN